MNEEFKPEKLHKDYETKLIINTTAYSDEELMSNPYIIKEMQETFKKLDNFFSNPSYE